MTRVRSILGLIAGVIFVLSSAAHSLLGWKHLRTELSGALIPPDLLRAVAIGWHFGGVAMLAFCCIAIWSSIRHLKGGSVSSFPALVIAMAYLCFGTWALIVSHLNPFFLIFIVPGVLLTVASLPALQRQGERL